MIKKELITFLGMADKWRLRGGYGGYGGYLADNKKFFMDGELMKWVVYKRHIIIKECIITNKEYR